MDAPDGPQANYKSSELQSSQARVSPRESDERYRKIFEHSNDAIFVIDPTRDRILDANPKACGMLGYPRETLLSMPISAVHPNEMPELEAFAQLVVEQGQGWTNELTCLTKSGEILPCEISASVNDISGQSCIISLVRDLTERRRSEKAVREMALFAEMSPNPVFRFDSEGTILSANLAAVTLLSPDAKKGVPLASILPSMGEIDLAKCIREDAVLIHETMARNRHFQFVVRGLSEFGFGHAYGSDITEIKKAQESLRELTLLEERNRLAREIHDSLAQGITGIIWQLNAAHRAVEKEGGPAADHLEKVRDLARDCLLEARRSVWDLRAGPLEGRTLAEALRTETERASSNGDLKASFSTSGVERVLPPGVEAALLRICQESLANVLKHSGATEVQVSLTFDESRVALEVDDNGIGFDPSEPTSRQGPAGGFGLINMRERTRLLGGEFTVTSEPGRGTKMMALVPLK